MWLLLAALSPRHQAKLSGLFLDDDLKEFQLRCPFYEAGDVKLEVIGARAFLTKALHCPTMRHEIIAVTEVPGYFVTFVLSSSQGDQLQSALLPFQDLLSSFQWFSPTSRKYPARKH